MFDQKHLIETLKLCFSYQNSPIQTLSTISLFFYQENSFRDQDNKKFYEQLNNSKYDLKHTIDNHRIFLVLSELKNFFFYFNQKGMNKKNFQEINLLKLKKESIQKFIHLSVFRKNINFLEKNKIKIFELLCEIKKFFLIIDYIGIVIFDENSKQYVNQLKCVEFRSNKMIFHLFRKLKNIENMETIENNLKEIHTIDYFFEDKLVKNEGSSAFFVYFFDGYQNLLRFWYRYTIFINRKFFIKWVVNLFTYKFNLEKLLYKVCLLKIEQRDFFTLDENYSKFEPQFFTSFEIKKFKKSMIYSEKDLEFNTFINYGETFSTTFENFINIEENFSKKTTAINQFNFSSISPLFIFDAIGFIFFQEIIKGMIALKNQIITLKKNHIPLGFEKRAIFSIGLISFNNYSERIMKFFIKKINKKDFLLFGKTGSFLIFKNLAFLLIGICFVIPRFFQKPFKSIEQIKPVFLKIIDFFMIYFNNIDYSTFFLFPYNLKRKHYWESKQKLLVIVLVSSSLIQTNEKAIFISQFFAKINHTVKFISNDSMLNREQDILLKFLPLIFGIPVLGFKLDLNLFNFSVYLPYNKFLQRLCIRMMQYCTFVGTIKKELFKTAIKEIRIFESIRIKKSERLFIIQEKFKKNLLPFNFFSIYDLNTDRELNRSFVYFRTNVEESILGICLLTLGDSFMSKLIYRIQSFFLSSDFSDYCSFAILSTAFLFLSNNECPAIDFIIKLSGTSNFVTVKNSIFSLGLIGAGTNNTRIKNALKCLANFYKLKIEDTCRTKSTKKTNDRLQFFRKLKAIIFLIRLSQGMVNSFRYNFLQKNILTGKINEKTIGPLLFTLFSFIISNFIGHESIFACFFLFKISMKSKLVFSLNENFKISSLKIKKTYLTFSKKKYILTPCFL
jgi:hypothetical protein